MKSWKETPDIVYKHYALLDYVFHYFSFIYAIKLLVYLALRKLQRQKREINVLPVFRATTSIQQLVVVVANFDFDGTRVLSVFILLLALTFLALSYHFMNAVENYFFNFFIILFFSFPSATEQCRRLVEPCQAASDLRLPHQPRLLSQNKVYYY